MERSSGKEDMNPYRLLDLIPNERKWLVKSEDGGGRRNHGCSDDKKLELRLGLPGDEEESWSNKNNDKPKERDGLVSLGYFPSVTHSNASNRNNSASCSQDQNQAYPAPWGYAKESSQRCCTRMDLPQGTTDMKNKAFSPPSANTAVPNSSQKRAAPAPVVGWPPIRSFRKNLASSSAAKSVPDPPSATPSTKPNEKKPTENCHKGFFVKINMDGVPIGRKVDLNAYDSYEKLSFAVDILFRGLLAAQQDSFARGADNKQEEKAITGLLDGTGEYTLVYEDSEGDRMLAGDVPWHMFVSTVKRLRVLKSSELSTISKAGNKERKLLNEC